LLPKGSQKCLEIVKAKRNREEEEKDSKSGQDAPKDAKKSTKIAQEAPKSPPKAHKSGQRAPKRRPKTPQSRQERATGAQSELRQGSAPPVEVHGEGVGGGVNLSWKERRNDKVP